MSRIDRISVVIATALGVVTGIGATIGVVAASGADGGGVPPNPMPPVASTDVPNNYAGRAVEPHGPALRSKEAIARVSGGAGMQGVHVERSADGVLEIHVKAGSRDQGLGLHATWIATLAQGALAELERTSQPLLSDVLGEVETVLDLPTGPYNEGGGHGFVASGQVFAAQADQRTDQRIRDDLAAAAAKFDLDVVSTEVLRPLGPAPHIVLRLRRLPDDLGWTIDDLRRALDPEPSAYEGLSLEIRSPDGTPLIAGTSSNRLGMGGLWFAPGEDERFHAVHGHLLSQQ
ncbi:hypothetical protein GCM10022237_31310 [Nocardioides ginsengisoli]|uniref:Uncharacterized protein n=1 Tax=Nocardioides ginsengisoli TaxID=363868 RepID=A0ABW3VVI6_9ACTN